MNPSAFHSLVWSLFLFTSVPADAFSLKAPPGQPGNFPTPIGYKPETVDLGQEYRWNSDVITYGFDRSFLDYFGAEGVSAVEDALKTIGKVPKASRIDLSAFPLDSRRFNVTAGELGVYDLKSITLARMLEQLGLAGPTEHIFEWDGSSGVFNYGAEWQHYCNFRNFDPDTLAPSEVVNGIHYGIAGFFEEHPLDPLQRGWNAVADQSLSPGEYYTGLTRDDAGGLRYLLIKTNVNQVPVIRNGRCMRAVNERGVEKLTFVQHPLWRPIARRSSNRVADVNWRFSQPDILFVASDERPLPVIFSGRPWLTRTESTNWINHAQYNGELGMEGPGVIRGPIRIGFEKLGPLVETVFGTTTVRMRGWASFKDSKVIEFPTKKGARFPYTLVWLAQDSRLIHVPIPQRETISLQFSHDALNWTTAAVLTNTGAMIEWNFIGNGQSVSFRFMTKSGMVHTARP